MKNQVTRRGNENTDVYKVKVLPETSWALIAVFDNSDDEGPSVDDTPTPDLSTADFVPNRHPLLFKEEPTVPLTTTTTKTATTTTMPAANAVATPIRRLLLRSPPQPPQAISHLLISAMQ